MQHEETDHPGSVISHLGVDKVGSYMDLDDSFPNHQPNPLEPKNLLDAQRVVQVNWYEFGPASCLMSS